MIRATIVLATLSYTLAEWLRFRRPARWRAARTAWTAGAALIVMHSAAALHFRHGWSHRQALESTAIQTKAVTGFDWGGGLYVNYVFLALWAADAIWWWLRPAAYAARPAPVTHALAAGFLFMFLNGAVVFAHGAMRWFGAACVGIVAFAWYLRIRRDSGGVSE